MMTDSLSEQFVELVTEYRDRLQPNTRRFIKRLHPEFVQRVDRSDVLGEFPTLNEKLWALRNNVMHRPVCYCGNHTNFHTSAGKYHVFCSTRCSRMNPDTLAARNARRIQSGAVKKAQATITARYGADGIKQRRQAGVRAKYGVDNYFSTHEFKQWMIAHNMEKYGVAAFSQTPEYLAKTKKTNLRRYGAEHYAQSEQYKLNQHRRYEQTSDLLMGLHGVRHSSQIKISHVMHLLQDSGWLYLQYIELNKTSSQIAHELSVSATTILNYLRRAEIDIKSFVHGYSRKCVHWLTDIMNNHGIDIQHALNGGEYCIPGTRYRADGYCQQTHTIYEFHGDVWHGNPALFGPADCPNPFSPCTARELYAKTLIKESLIQELGYNLVVMWEHQWDSELKQRSDMHSA